MPAGAQAPGIAAEAAPLPSEPAPALDCAAVEADRVRQQAMLVQTRRAISDLAFNRPQHRRKVGAGDVGRAAAGTAASVLLPFGIGLALNAVAGAAMKGKGKGKTAPPPRADVPALIDRQHAIEARLKELAALPCAAASASVAPAAAGASGAHGKPVPAEAARSGQAKALVVPGPSAPSKPRE